jgi:hypothetical protein
MEDSLTEFPCAVYIVENQLAEGGCRTYRVK